MITILIRIVLIYILLILVIRLSGKRQIGELQLTDLITALLISELAIMPIGNNNIPITFAIVPILAVICLEIINTFISAKFNKLKPIMDGKPSFIINKGKLNLNELEKLRISIEELIAETRIAGISDIGDIQYAILELNGQMSVFPKAKRGEKDRGIAHAIIVDGTINDYNLIQTNLSRADVNDMLLKKNVNIENVLLFSVDDSGNQNWILRKDYVK